MSRFREVGLVAEGGMATVVRATRDDGATVVLKRIRPPLSHDPAYLRLFADEGRLHAALDHAHIVRLLEQGQDDAGPYLVFEYVDGSDLGLVLEARAAAVDARERALDVACVVAVAIPLFEALAAIHEASDAAGAPLRVVHRDVSPGNVLIGTDGDVTLADFGVATSALKTEATVAGELKGKFAYMAPEQTRGEPVDARTDLFAAGVVLWECLAGRRLFDGPTDADVVAAVRGLPAPALGDVRSDVPPALAGLVARLLHKEPGGRPATARDALDLLRATALELGLDEGLRRHAARLARDAPRQAPAAREADGRRLTQRVSGHGGPAVVVVQRAGAARSRVAAAIVGLVTLGVAGAVAWPGRMAAPAPGAGTTVEVGRAPGAPDMPPAATDPSTSTTSSTALSTSPSTQPSPAPSGDASVGPPMPTARPPRAQPVASRPRPREAPASGAAARASAVAQTPGGAAPLALGRLTITAEPWAAVTVDDALVARETPLKALALPAGRHTVVLENPVFGRRVLEVDVPANGELRRFVDLTR